MKVTTAKHGLRSLVMLLLLFGAFLFGASRVEAQDLSAATLNWMSESEALSKLDTEIQVYLTDQADQTPGTPAWTNDENHIVFYKLVMTRIGGGSTVYRSVEESLITLSTGVVSADYALSAATIQGLKDDAIVLLTL